MDRRRTFAVGAAAAALALPGAALAVSAPGAADSFTGHVSSARGHWRHDHGRLAVRLNASGTGVKRHLTMHLSAVRCGSRKLCVALSGKLTGTITALAPLHPDTGRRFAIAATGTVHPLGQVHASGTLATPGFISGRRETLRVTLSASGGAVTVAGIDNSTYP